MNIFYTDPDPVICAKNLDDKRRNKMLVETAQLLCTTLHLHGVRNKHLYKPTHNNHPCRKWVDNQAKFKWLLNHAYALSSLYTQTTGKIHRTSELLPLLEFYMCNLPKGRFSPPPNCASNKALGISYKHVQDTCLAYQMYLNDRWDTDKTTPKFNGMEI